MDESQIKLAAEISDILKDQNLSTEERLLKMRSILNPKILENDLATDKEKKEVPPATYGNQTIKKAALRNQIINKNK